MRAAAIRRCGTGAVGSPTSTAPCGPSRTRVAPGTCGARRETGCSGTHAQSPLEADARRGFAALPYYAYDPALRFAVDIVPLDAEPVTAEAGHDGALTLRPFASTRGLADALGAELTLYWLAGYCGGVFLPFADATSGRDTYGGGRYLLDTIKSADLGSDAAGRTVLDFNFSYNPSCSYSPAYVCPLSPPANRLRAAVRGGEKAPRPAG